MALSRIVGQNRRHQGLTYIVSHRDNACILRWYLKALLYCGDRAVKVGICH